MADIPVTIVVPTWRRPDELARCLTALRAELLARRHAEVVTLHAPGDEVAEERVRRDYPEVTVLRAPARNLSLQRNLAARHAKGDIVVYLDDDAWPIPGWLDALLAPFADQEVAAVGGRVLRGDGSLQYGAMAVSTVGRPFVLRDEEDPPRGTARTLPGGNLAVRRDVLCALGGFDENFAYHFDDVDFSLRLWRSGYKTVYRADASIHHEPAPGPHRRTFWDRDWHTIAQNSIYLAFRHAPPGKRRWAVLLQVPKAARFCWWACTGRLTLGGLWRALRGLATGIVAGWRKGKHVPPALPLRRDDSPPRESRSLACAGATNTP